MRATHYPSLSPDPEEPVSLWPTTSLSLRTASNSRADAITCGDSFAPAIIRATSRLAAGQRRAATQGVNVRPARTCLEIWKVRPGACAICGRCVMHKTDGVERAPAGRARPHPPLPHRYRRPLIDTSVRAKSSVSTRVRRASMIRDSSPPTRHGRANRGSSPGLDDSKNSTSRRAVSRPLFGAVVALDLDNDHRDFGMASSASVLFERPCQLPAASRRARDNRTPT